MSIEFSCPHCGKLLRTSDDRAGARAVCPECSATIDVPAAQLAATIVEAPPVEVTGVAQEPIHSAATPPQFAGATLEAAPQRRPCRVCSEPLSEWLLRCPSCGAPTGMTPAVHVGQVVYGGFWIRFVAFLLDWLTFAIIGGFLERISFARGIGSGTSMLLAWFYFALLESSKHQATVGKMLLGLVVTDEAGRPIGFGRATARYWAKYLSIITLLFGYIMAAFMPRKRALHDMIAGTLVLYKNCLR